MNKQVIISLRVLVLMVLAHSALGQGGKAKGALHFSANPDDAEIYRARVFDEPLIPIGGQTQAVDNRSVADALTIYAGRTNLDDFSSLTGFLAHFPQSPWAGSLHLHLGIEYYNCGYYTKAMDAWEQAWKQCENDNAPKAKIQADRALGELARMYSKLGRMRELKELLDSATNRPLSGPGTQLIRGAKEALWMMQNHPEISFRCGPLALNSILTHSDPQKAPNPLIYNSKSTTNGFSLSQVAELSRRLGLNYQMAFRSPGAVFIAPAVAHWKAGHYAAVLQKDDERFLVQDLTFRGSLRMSTAALEEEGSGYFLVPSGPLPNGWRPVPALEADAVWGKGVTSGTDPNATSPTDVQEGGGSPSDTDASEGGGSSGSCGGGGSSDGGMPVYAIHALLATLTLHDTPLRYRPPVGPPVPFTITYSQGEVNQPATFYYSNLGPSWTCNWIAYIMDNPTSTNTDVTFYAQGGGTYPITGFNPTNQKYTIEINTQALLIKTSSSSYEIQMPDGSMKVFGLPDGSVGTTRRVFLTQIVDPAGNAVTLNYDSMLRITNIIDAIGQSTRIVYGNFIYPYAITQVIDPFGRAAQFEYNYSGYLTKSTDVLGLTSQYTYDANDFITNMTTPYGTTIAASGMTNGVTWIQVTDPMGQNELLEATENTVLPFSDPGLAPVGMPLFNEYLYGRDSYYWNKTAFVDAAGDFTRAKILHFLHDVDETTTSRVLESVKQPLENRVWYDYPGQTTAGFLPGVTVAKPSLVGRVLDNGTTQLSSYGFNAFGNRTNMVDPLGRSFAFDYGTNGVDFIAARMTHKGQNQMLANFTYNSQHLPLTITDASGQTTTNTYNPRGQILTTTDPKGETTSFSYDTNGYLLTITGPLQTANDVVSLTYDGFARVRTLTDTEGYVVTIGYDVMDRPISVSYPDGTQRQFVYNILDLVASSDRLGRWMTNTYNAIRQLTQTQDPLGRITSFTRCKCGSLTGLIDPMGRTTSWQYDLQQRPVSKQYVDGTTIAYTYENTTSRLKSRLDEKGQQTIYAYNSDNTLQSLSYSNATIPTPTVSFAYDPDFSRVLTMQDGIGTTIYAYNPITSPAALGAGQLASVSGPLSSGTVTYQYDPLGRVISRAINGVAQAMTYDGLGRPTIVTNALGSFTYSYVDATSRLASEAYPNGQTTLYSYYNNIGDQRLLAIQHFYPNGTLLSAFGYSYNAVGQITAWTNQWDTLPTRVSFPTYDAADQLTNFASFGGPSAATNYAYAYDPAGNRTLAQSNTVPSQFSYNALNQIMSSISGMTNSATYEWDAENRLTAINQGANRSQFSYDGLGRRVQIVELTNGVVMTNNYYLWCGNEICEMRDSTGATVLKRLFSQGETLIDGTGSTNYFYARDHLGSIREAVDSNGDLATRYDYDPYGQQTVFQEKMKTTFAFTGCFVDSESGLYFTFYRIFNSSTGRWLSRDPLNETYGMNLYAYVSGNPINYIDQLGLCDYNNFNPITGETWEPGNVPDSDEDPAESGLTPEGEEGVKEFEKEMIEGLTDKIVEPILDETGKKVLFWISVEGGTLGLVNVKILLTPQVPLSAKGDEILPPGYEAPPPGFENQGPIRVIQQGFGNTVPVPNPFLTSGKPVPGPSYPVYLK